MTETSAHEYTDFDGNALPPDEAEALKRLFERSQAPNAEGWRPSPGDTVVGKVVEIDTGTSEFGAYPLLTILQPNGTEVAVHCFHTVLQNRIDALIERDKLREGSLISIHYEGTQESNGKGRSDMHVYKVAVQR